MANIYDNSMTPGVANQVFIPDQLIAGDLKLVTQQVTLLTGKGVLARGTVLGQISASGKYIPSVQTATDGSQVPSAILVDIADTTAGDVRAGIYQMGEFNSNALTFDASWSIATLTPAMRTSSIFIKSTPLGLTNAAPT